MPDRDCTPEYYRRKAADLEGELADFIAYGPATEASVAEREAQIARFKQMAEAQPSG